MNYETFLFTRNQRRDFTAFIRPKDLTNKEVSTLAGALNYINDIAALSEDWPALYCFPLGQYILLLRHYDSGRKHAGRAIGVLEGIAVRRTRARHFALALPHFLAHQGELLAVSQSIGDIEAQATVETSPEKHWPDVQAAEAAERAGDELVNQFVARLGEDRLFLPFDDDGRALLVATLSDSRLPPLYFAFGTNADVIARLNQGGVDVDIVSYFNTSAPALRSRATNEITSELRDYVRKAPRRAKPARQPDDTPETPLPPSMQTPRQSRGEAKRRTLQEDPLSRVQAAEGETLTPRQMARQQAEAERAQQEAAPEGETALSWLTNFIARLLGRKK